jgi:hypothetical protein
MRPIDDSPPSMQEWKHLFAAAIEFKKTEAWTWMYDDQVFGVQNPENGEIGYCCIMGALGEFFGLGVYMGTGGLEAYRDLQTGRVKREELLYTQDCLLASFEDRKQLDSEDLAIIKKLGLKFRGSNAWPVFRSHAPGYYPWHLNQGEARFLRIALEQGREVALMVRDDETLLNKVAKGLFLVQVPRAEGDRVVWETRHLKPTPLAKKARHEEPAEVITEADLQLLKGKKVQRGVTWEADLFFAPIPIREGKGRPFFPYAMLVVDRYSGLVLECNIMPQPESRSVFQKRVCELLKSSASLPERVLLSRKELQKLIDPILAPLNITSRLVKMLEAIEDAKTSLFERLTG